MNNYHSIFSWIFRFLFLYGWYSRETYRRISIRSPYSGNPAFNERFEFDGRNLQYDAFDERLTNSRLSLYFFHHSHHTGIMEVNTNVKNETYSKDERNEVFMVSESSLFFSSFSFISYVLYWTIPVCWFAIVGWAQTSNEHLLKWWRRTEWSWSKYSKETCKPAFDTFNWQIDSFVRISKSI